MTKYLCVILVLAVCSVTPLRAQTAAGARITPAQFKQFQWITGRWRGTGAGRLAGVRPFYEEYVMLDDSTMRLRTASDSTFSVATDSSDFLFRGGLLLHREARSDKAATRFAGDSIQWGDPGVLYLRVTNDVWRAYFPVRQPNAERPFYELRRVR